MPMDRSNFVITEELTRSVGQMVVTDSREHADPPIKVENV